MTRPSVIIVGAGVAGLSAAVHCCEAGHRVTLLEKRTLLGGRVYSFRDPKSGDDIDNGQHVLLGAYRYTLDLLKKIGSDHLLEWQDRLTVWFRTKNGQRFRFRCWPLPAPFHLLGGLLSYSQFPNRDIWQLLKSYPSYRQHIQHPLVVDHLTISEWLDQMGQSSASRLYFWERLVEAIFNEPSERVAASALMSVFKEGLLKGNRESALIIPRAGLAHIFADPARRFMETHGGLIVTGKDVVKIDMAPTSAEGKKMRVSAVIDQHGNRHEADAFIFAIPPHAVQKIENLNISCSWESSVIATVHMWLDVAADRVMTEQIVSLMGGHFDWCVRHGNRLTFLMCDAGKLTGKSREAVIQLAIDDFHAFYDGANGVAITHTTQGRELQAVLALRPNGAPHRLGPKSEFHNLFLAGDWTNTALPSTIESAVKSGVVASHLVKNLY